MKQYKTFNTSGQQLQVAGAAQSRGTQLLSEALDKADEIGIDSKSNAALNLLSEGKLTREDLISLRSGGKLNPETMAVIKARELKIDTEERLLAEKKIREGEQGFKLTLEDARNENRMKQIGAQGSNQRSNIRLRDELGDGNRADEFKNQKELKSIQSKNDIKLARERAAGKESVAKIKATGKGKEKSRKTSIEFDRMLKTQIRTKDKNGELNVNYSFYSAFDKKEQEKILKQMVDGDQQFKYKIIKKKNRLVFKTKNGLVHLDRRSMKEFSIKKKN